MSLCTMVVALSTGCSDDSSTDAPDASITDVAFDPDADPPCPRQSTASYVRHLHSATREPTYWSREAVLGCLPIAYDPVGTADIPGDAERDALWRSLARWSDAAQACDAPLCFLDAGDVAYGDGIGYNQDGAANFNLVTFVTDPAAWADKGRTSATVATTILTTKTSTGEVLDADIEMNNVDFVYSAAASPPGPAGTLDVESVLVHELGHLLGLDHTTDHSSVMFPTEAVGELKRELGVADHAGICEVYACY